MEYHKEKHGVPPAGAPWERESWDLDRTDDYIKSKPGVCVVMIEDNLVDVTTYLGEHPGGAKMLRKYSVPEQQDLVDASWAFGGGSK
ncbi:hypothetical protein DFH07DRAFT_967291 [Mycena maculata]|uniref:Cytochrome b5 heme-binding domain-containing protein n=1 Tax=Mycena maculata TaxID=230809 RepID=A0AAD7MVV0_9AGAR|nr:hypothetical protein DFH07DRAFT_967291 [Mycena maculata]